MLLSFILITSVLFFFFFFLDEEEEVEGLLDKIERCVLHLHPDALLSNKGMGMCGVVSQVCVLVCMQDDCRRRRWRYRRVAGYLMAFPWVVILVVEVGLVMVLWWW